MQFSYSPGIAVLGVGLALTCSYLVLFLASRVENSRGGAGRLWIGGAAVAMGMGAWLTHFVAMLGWQSSFALTYDPVLQLVALLVATAAFGASLRLVAWCPQPRYALLWGAAFMGVGLLAMEFIGLAALRVSPGIGFSPGTVLTAVAVAMGGSLLALRLNARLAERPQWQVLTRLAAAAVLGATLTTTHYRTMAALHVPAAAVATDGIPLQGFWLAVTVGAVAFAMLSMTGVFMVVDDHMAARTRRYTAQLAEMNAKLRHAAQHDPLTGLPNRALLTDTLSQQIELAAAGDTCFAVMLVDLDRFKAVNDSLGHQAGDQLLCTMAERLRAALRPTDTLARIGGDEFIVLRDDVREVAEVDRLAHAIQAAITPVVIIDGAELQLSCTTGITLYPEGGRDAATLLRHADAAMYHGKSMGRRRHSFYQAQMDRYARERLELESGLRRAVTGNELVLHYQPRIDVISGRITGAEALIRWMHPRRGLVPPSEFIPIAEETSLIEPLTAWALREATLQMRRWIDAGCAPQHVSVNLSASLLAHPDLERLIVDSVREAGLDPGLLELELTESAVMRDPERSVQVLRSLVRRGLRISVDDFGTGYSSLSYLRRLPLHVLKVDRSFIRDAVTNREDAEITRAIITLAHSLKLKVTAEGVETESQLAFLRALGCDEYQGYFASPAVPADQFAAMTQQSMSATQRLRFLGKRTRSGPLRA